MNLLLPLLLGGMTIALPVAAILWLLRSRADSGALLLLRVLQTGGIVMFAWSAGAWSYSSWYLRDVILALFASALVYSIVRSASLPWSIDRRLSFRRRLARIGSLVAIGFLNLLQIDGRFYGGDALDLRFPLASGRYCVLQGGRGPLANPFHYLYGASRYALDIVRLNRLGNRATGLAPGKLEEYEIFGDSVLAPCDCRVVRSVDRHPDQLPGVADAAHAAGNHILLQCGDLELMLAHLKRGSVRVDSGAYVRAGDLLGAVGNSGNSAEPHLHIQATRYESRANRPVAVPVPITFGGIFLSINDVIEE